MYQHDCDSHNNCIKGLAKYLQQMIPEALVFLIYYEDGKLFISLASEWWQ